MSHRFLFYLFSVFMVSTIIVN
uniref:Uncharacterized protein n=1 Tax=Arundo donax TaxID=35708 RepID=A0A0A8YQC7_ARUDO